MQFCSEIYEVQLFWCTDCGDVHFVLYPQAVVRRMAPAATAPNPGWTRFKFWGYWLICDFQKF